MTLGWFGDPWPSFVCYDAEWNLREPSRVAFPAGKLCTECRLPFQLGDQGERIIVGTIAGWKMGHVHRECQLLAILGECTKTGQERRREAIATWALITKDIPAVKPSATAVVARAEPLHYTV